MFFKKELYIGNDNYFINSLVRALEHDSIKVKIIHNNLSHLYDVPRGVAACRNNEPNNDMISIYVNSKDYDNAINILNSLKL